MGSTEARVDYMGSSILMGIFSNADLKLQDEWKVNLYNTLDSSITDKRYDVLLYSFTHMISNQRIVLP